MKEGRDEERESWEGSPAEGKGGGGGGGGLGAVGGAERGGAQSDEMKSLKRDE